MLIISLGPEVAQQTTKNVKLIQERKRIAQSRQKSYQDKRRKDLEFEVVYSCLWSMEEEAKAIMILIYNAAQALAIFYYVNPAIL